MRHPFRSAALAAGLVAVLAAPIAGVLPAAASDSSSATPAALPNLKSPRIEGQACKDDTGITVVVDFRDLTNAQGKRMNLVEIGCAEQPVGNGFDALLGAGFQVDPNQPFVCQIDDRPMNSADCSDVGYWAYAHGLRGHRWHYSNVERATGPRRRAVSRAGRGRPTATRRDPGRTRGCRPATCSLASCRPRRAPERHPTSTPVTGGHRPSAAGRLERKSTDSLHFG